MTFFVLYFLTAAFIAWAWIHQYRQTQRLREQDYEWYRSRYPDNVKGNRVTCNTCGSDRITVRGLMRQTRLREHVCTQCGSALYYSQEGR